VLWMSEHGPHATDDLTLLSGLVIVTACAQSGNGAVSEAKWSELAGVPNVPKGGAGYPGAE